MTMHVGNLNSPNDNAAKRTYRLLKRGWQSSADIIAKVGTTCPTTRVHEVKVQLGSGEVLEKRMRKGERAHYAEWRVRQLKPCTCRRCREPRTDTT